MQVFHPRRKFCRCDFLFRDRCEHVSAGGPQGSCSGPTWAKDLVRLGGDVVPVHVADEARQGGHAFVLIQLVHFKVHNCIWSRNHLLSRFLEHTGLGILPSLLEDVDFLFSGQSGAPKTL